MAMQQSNGNAIAQPGQQKGCPAMCVRWDTVLKENGQLENTPVVTSPMVPGDTITQCPKQCDPKCCNTGSQAYSQPDQVSQGLQSDLPDDQSHPPACMAGCPKACYPACRPGCCNTPRMMSMYQQNMAQQNMAQQNMAQQTPMMQPMPQPYVQEPVAQSRETIPNPAFLSYPSQEPAAQSRETIPNPAFISYPSQNINGAFPDAERDIIPYSAPQGTSVRSSISYPSVQYSQPQPAMMPQTRAAIPQPATYYATGQPAQLRSKIPKSTVSVHIATCPIPCSPICVPHCTKHCCESYD